MPTIADLPTVLQGLDAAARADVERVLRVTESVGFGEVPEPFRAKVARWCGGDGGANSEDAASSAWRQAEQQRVVSAHSLWTFETANFNVLRAVRPVGGGGRSSAARRTPDEVSAACEGLGLCDFCDMERLTCVEPFGRVCGKHSSTAGNVFKSAGLHGLVIWKRHRLHRLAPEELLDGLQTADAWVERAATWAASRAEAEGRPAPPAHPVAFWNCFRSGGASQIHPHMQLQLFHAPVAQEALLLEQCRRYRGGGGEEAAGGGVGAEGARGDGRRELVVDTARAHEHLGLALKDPVPGAAFCWATLTPRVGGGELCALGAESALPPARPRLASLAPALGGMMGALRRCGAEGISIVAFLVPVDEKERVSWLLRCANRGAVEPEVVDAGSAELAGLTGVGADPFAQLAALREELAAPR